MQAWFPASFPPLLCMGTWILKISTGFLFCSSRHVSFRDLLPLGTVAFRSLHQCLSLL